MMSTQQAVHLVWFRQDLRITDNLALSAACNNTEARVIALFIATPVQWRSHSMSARQAWFIREQVVLLRRSLGEKGIPLYCLSATDFADSVSKLAAFCEAQCVSHMFYNYQYELNERQRDKQAEKQLFSKVTCQGFDDSVLLPPGSVLTGNNEMFRVFTPFSKAFLRRLRETPPQCVPAPRPRGPAISDDTPIEFDYPQEPVDTVQFPPGEKAALQKLRIFCQQQVLDYHEQRDFPALSGTSMVSAWLATGALSPRQCFQRLLAEHPYVMEREGGAAVWLNELIWREFYRHLLVAWPALCRHQPFIRWTDSVAWSHDENLLGAWQQGKTGYPIVDAGMRQLNRTGWMHNRLRMITASFLTKDLQIDWREGERWFMEQLLDGDFAANNGGWQWAASTGTDAAPYFRIFNPETQSNRFDEQGKFIRQWLPELHRVPDSAIHNPWKWADKQGVTLDYPRPVVDHKTARLNTLSAWEAAREKMKDKQ
ncbi:deoxyribodipyrimidine photo-lyase [Mangrovibacter yixingensis]|uniref:deoxyribodipyrimidine photo-lyase n=1 Tax=Mangrovibacter yixingensis TaxID=1529639 RepID=UPI001CFB21B8|nr:deoxyribodipyrimidine photo-lyase [Mangrovibacter yixingensis]